MIHGGYDTFADPYCYKGTFVLKQAQDCHSNFSS